MFLGPLVTGLWTKTTIERGIDTFLLFYSLMGSQWNALSTRIKMCSIPRTFLTMNAAELRYLVVSETKTIEDP